MTGDAEVTESPAAVAAPAGVDRGRFRAQQLLAASARYALRSEDLEDLCATLLRQVVTSFDGAVAGAVWLQTDSRLLQQLCSEGFEPLTLKTDPGLSEVHGKVLNRFFEKGGTAVWNADADLQGVRLPSHLLLAAVEIDGEPRGVFEVVVGAERPASFYEPYLNLLGSVTSLLSDWLNRKERQSSNELRGLKADADDYARQVHASLDMDTLCGVVANESRRHLGVDRVTVAVGSPSPRVRSVSGQATIDRRANQVVALTELIGRVAEFGETLAYDGRAGDNEREFLPPQIEQALDRYLDESFAKQLLIYPIHGEQRDSDAVTKEIDNASGAATSGEPSPFAGVLVIECFEAERPLSEIKENAESILGHTQNALRNAAELNSVPFLRLWQTIGRWTLPTAMSRGLRVAAVVAAVAGVLLLWPTTFSVRSEGTLEPSVKRGVFTDIDGVVESVLVEHGQRVEVDQVLLEVRSPDLEVEITDVVGRRRIAEEQARSEERKMVDPQLGSVEKHRLAGSRKAYLEEQRGLEEQQALLERKRGRLKVRSAFKGEVITWDASRRLLHRPVQQGDQLLTLADPSGPWELELFIQDRRIGHVLHAMRENDEPLTVEFILATHPTKRFEGRLREVHELSQHHAERGWGALAHVDIDSRTLPELHAGSRVAARVVCGRSSLGFAWFHELVEWFAVHVFF